MSDTTQTERWIEYVRVEDLREAEVNPKAHADGVLDSSLGRFGYTEPPLLDERTGRIIAGHGRKAALLRAQAAGVTPPSGIKLDTDGAWMVPLVRGWSSTDDVEARAYLVTSNRSSEVGGWYEEMLATMLQEVAVSPTGLTGTGFSVDELADLVASVAGPPNLDDLAGDHGPPDPAAFWPVLRFKVPPVIKARYLALVEQVEGGDVEQFTWLLDQAIAGVRATKP